MIGFFETHEVRRIAISALHLFKICDNVSRPGQSCKAIFIQRFKIVAPIEMLHNPTGIALVVGGQFHITAQAQYLIEGIDKAILNQAVFVVFAFGPGIWMNNEDTADRVSRDNVYHRSIYVEPHQADIFVPLWVKLAQDAADALTLDFNAQKVAIPLHQRFGGDEFTLAAPNLDIHRIVVTKNGRKIQQFIVFMRNTEKFLFLF